MDSVVSWARSQEVSVVQELESKEKIIYIYIYIYILY